MGDKRKRVLIVEDEMLSALCLQDFLDKLGYSADQIAISAEEVFAAMDNGGADIVLMDVSISGKMDGIEACARVVRDYGVPVVMLTAFSDRDVQDRSRKSGCSGFMTKPVEMYDLKETIGRIIGV